MDVGSSDADGANGSLNLEKTNQKKVVKKNVSTCVFPIFGNCGGKYVYALVCLL